MRKRGVNWAVLTVVLSIFVLSFTSLASAESYTFTRVNNSFGYVEVSNADNMYSYEINLNYEGNVPTAAFTNFLTSSGGTQTTGIKLKNGVLSVYASRLDNTKSGVSGNGRLFNLTFSGTDSSTTNNAALSSALDVSGQESDGSAGAENTVFFTTSSGTTTSGSSGGGGGGGGAGIQTISPSDVDLSFDPSDLAVNLMYERDNPESFKITNNGNAEIVLKVSSEGLNDVLNIPTDTVYLAPGQTVDFDFSLFGAVTGISTGKIVFTYAGTVVGEVNIVANVRSENFLFDTLISIADRYKTISVGEKITAQINLLEVKSSEKVDVVATYVIKDFSGNSYHEESETFFVEDEKEYTKEFDTSQLPPGKYILGLEIVYPGAFATSSVQFNVVSKEQQYTTIAIGAAVIVVLGAVAFLFFRRANRTPLRSSKRTK